eukprot:10047482-Karenia_brevis.AAC.1
MEHGLLVSKVGKTCPLESDGGCRGEGEGPCPTSCEALPWMNSLEYHTYPLEVDASESSHAC